MSNKISLHVFLSTILLLPVAIILENSDGAETIHLLVEYITAWSAPVALSAIISGLIFGIKRILNKETSFLNIYYHTAYSMAIFVLLAVSIKYL